MAERPFGQPINLNRNEIRNPVIHNVSAAPGTIVAGQLWFDTVGNALNLRRNADTIQLGSGGGGLSNAYATITDGTTPAAASGGDTFKIRTANGYLTVVTQSNDATHGDNVLFTLNAKTARTTNEAILVATAAGDGKIDTTFLTGKLAMADLTDGTTTGTGSITRQSYVDAIAQGIRWKETVRAATVGSITLSGTQTVDGVALNVGDRVLVKVQGSNSDPTHGIYVVAAGAWARAEDANTSADVKAGMTVHVSEGTVNADTTWTLVTNDPITLGTTNLQFTQSFGPGAVQGLALGANGTPVYKNTAGNVLQFYNIHTTTNRLGVALNGTNNDVELTVNEGNILLQNLGGTLTLAKGGTGATDAAGARTALGVGTKYTALIGDNSATTFTIARTTHLASASRANIVQTLDESSGEYRTDSIQVAANGDVTIGINPAPATNAVRVIIYG